MAEETATRARVRALRDELSLALRALAAVAMGDAALTQDNLGQLAAPVQPLLGSPLVGDGAAFGAMRAIARCLNPELRPLATYTASALRIVSMSGGRADQWGEKVSKSQFHCFFGHFLQ